MLQRNDCVFYCDNRSTNEYFTIASSVIRDIGLVPLAYRGVGLSARKSNLDKELREDFFRAKAIVILLGMGEGWNSDDPMDSWAIQELKHVSSATLLVYTVSDIPDNTLSVSYNITKIGNAGEFKKSLTSKLQLLTTKRDP